MRRGVIVTTVLVLLFVSLSHAFEAPIGETTEVLKQTNEEFIVTAVDGEDPYTFYPSSCVYLIEMSDTEATYETGTMETSCESVFVDSLYVAGVVRWLLYDYVCDGCTQYTNDLMSSPDSGILFSEIEEDEEHAGDGSELEEEEEEEHAGDGSELEEQKARLDFEGYSYVADGQPSSGRLDFDYSSLSKYNFILDEDDIDVYYFKNESNNQTNRSIWLEVNATINQTNKSLSFNWNTFPQKFRLGQKVVVANNLQCRNGSSWVNCTALNNYGDNLSQVRVNCSDPHGLSKNTTFIFHHNSTNTTHFKENATSRNGDQWTYDNVDFLFSQEGSYSMKAFCIDTRGKWGSITQRWTIGP